MTNNEEMVTVEKSVLINNLMAVEKGLAWQDFVLSRLCLDLALVRQEVQDLVLDSDMIKAKSNLIDLLFPGQDFTPLLTDELHETWTKEFEQRTSPMSRYENRFYKINLDS